MSKTQKEKATRKQFRDEHPLIPLKYQHIAAVLTLLLSLVLFFNQIIFGGKTFLPPDAIASHSWDTIIKDAKEQGIFPLWNPYIFCGMPAYASLTFTGERLFDLTGFILGKTSQIFQLILLNSPLGWVLFFYFVFATGVYTLTFSKVNNKIASLIAAIGATYSMHIIGWIMISHNTKIAVLCWLPWIFFSLEKQRQRFNWKYALFLIPLFHFSFLPGHVQMIFYSFLALGMYFLTLIVQILLKKKTLHNNTIEADQAEKPAITEWKGILRAGTIMVLAAFIAFGLDSDKYLSVLEYNSYSIRGSAPIMNQGDTDAKTQEGGLSYDYATNWSFSPGELMTFMIPSWYGFGWHEYNGRFAARPIRVNTYWGPQPGVDCPQYMGIVIFILAIIGVIRCRKDPFVQFLIVSIAFFTLIAFGREFPLVYDLMYKYFPTFNKFRVPLMILSLVQMFVPILAAYGISSLMNQHSGLNPNTEKKWKYTLYGLAGLFFLALIFRGIFEGIYTNIFPMREVGNHIARSLGTGQTEVVNEFYGFVINSVITDMYFNLVFLILILGAFLMYLKGSLKLSTLSIVLIIVVTFDLWRVDSKPMEPQEKQDQQSIFAKPEYVKFLQQDKSLYRTLTFIDGQPPYDNTSAYWKIQNAYGYHGAKIRAYQDMVDVAGLANPLVWQLMNVKYIITNKSDSSGILQLAYDGNDRKVYLNRALAPRAFFVNRYEVSSGIDILNKISALSFNPSDVAYVTEDPKLQIDPPQNNTTAEYTRYDIQDFELTVTATGNNLLFLSEAYYPVGWKAFIDGNEIPIYRLNYLFRGVVVPIGTHKLEMKFEPKGFYVGRTISLITNILVCSGFAITGYIGWKRRRAAITVVS